MCDRKSLNSFGNSWWFTILLWKSAWKYICGIEPDPLLLRWPTFRVKKSNFRALQMTKQVELYWLVQTAWSDLTKIHHFGQILSVLGNFRKGHLALGIILNLLWQFFNGIGQFFIGASGQVLKNNLAIWSHCLFISLPTCM